MHFSGLVSSIVSDSTGNAMPALLTAIFAFIGAHAGKIIAMILISMGVTVVVYTGLTAYVVYLQDTVVAEFNALPANAYCMAEKTGTIAGINIIFTAMATAVAIRGTKRVFKFAPI